MKFTIQGATAVFLFFGVVEVSGAPTVDFSRDIRPLLSDRCVYCHGPDARERKGDLRLDTRQGIAGVVTPGSPAESTLIKRILHTDNDEKMPPLDSGKSLTPAEIELLKEWINDGAVWEEHWAYREPKRTQADGVPTWRGSWVDFYVYRKMNEAGVSPSPDAGKVSLLRRWSFDLTGLPPDPADAAAYLSDDRPEAGERYVDRLLASPAYGERMAAYWLDLVRYADTVGYHGDQDQNITPYRDYVIDAFNANLPLDQFTRDQLAGDLLSHGTIDQKIASGYNRLLQTSHEGGVQPREYLAIYAADRVRNVSNVWMAATMGCSQCHDHKFDPYTTHDFYSLAAFFADLDEAQHFKKGTNELPTARPPEIKVLSRLDRSILASMEAEKNALGADKSFNRQTRTARVAQLEKQIKSVHQRSRLTMVSKSTEPRTMRVLPRGNWLDDSGDIAMPAVPVFLGALDGTGRRTRLDLANWLTDPDQAGKLTARVFANRFWYLAFGEGLSRVLDDFGGQGEPPSHPQLLDRLALWYLDHGWDTKAMMRLLVTSRTYGQSSRCSPARREHDPANRLFARQNTFRRPAEMIRDTALAVSGLLVNEIGGESVKPYQPPGYYRHLNFPTRQYKHHADVRQWRRAVYVHWQRQFLHPMLRAFDAPSREECTAQRPRSNTPTAALTLLNDPTFVEAARVFAERILRESGARNEERLNYAFELTLSRPPDETEKAMLANQLAIENKYFSTHRDAANKLLHVGDSMVPEDLPLPELAAWTMVCRTLFNLHETYARH